MKKFIVILAFALCLSSLGANAQEEKSYKDGAVTRLTYVITKPGKFDDYLKFLDTTYKTLMEAHKKAGLITSYAVYSSSPRTLQEPDIILSTTFENMAALDKIDEADAVSAQVLGGLATQNKSAEDRESIRTILGSELIREMKLK